MYLQTIPAYVYQIRNRITREYYIGFRKAHIAKNRLPEQDFLIYYFTSSTKVLDMIKEHGLKSFEGEILYQDTDHMEAYWYEQKLIKQNWSDPLLLNGHYQDRVTNKNVFLLSSHTESAKLKISKAHKGKAPSKETIEKMVKTRRDRRNYKHGPETIEKMLTTKKKNGTMNSNTPESREKSRQTKLERYGVPHPKHTLETIKKLKGRKRSAEEISKCLETKKKNGTMNSNTPESINKRRETLLEKYGTLNTREIAKINRTRNV